MARENNKQVADKLETISERMAVVVAWIEEQKRIENKPKN
jgi:hypothetical protein